MYGTLSDSPVDMAKLTQSIKLNEGLRLLPYTDTTGHLSIGYGRALSVKGISLDEANIMLDNDLQEVINEAQKQTWWLSVSNNDARMRACAEMCFNLGVGGFNGFKNAVQCLMKMDYAGAANNFMDSLWAKQLPARVSKLTQMIETGLD